MKTTHSVTGYTHGMYALRAVFAASLLGLLAACGQKGPLYLPDQAREVVTRPSETPVPAPDAQDPEATAPQNDDKGDKDKKQPDATAPR